MLHFHMEPELSRDHPLVEASGHSKELRIQPNYNREPLKV